MATAAKFCETCKNYAEIEVSSNWGSIKGITAQTLGTLCLAVLGGFLVWQLTAGVTTRLDKLVDSQGKTATQIERLIDRLDQKAK